MDREQFNDKIVKSSESLTPRLVKLLEFEDGAAKVLIVSDAFDGIRLKGRIDLIWGLIEQNSPEIINQFLLSFEPYTDAEFIQIDSETYVKNEPKKRNPFAASP